MSSSTVVPVSETARKLTFYDLRKFLTIEEIANIVRDLPAQEAYKLRYDYDFWARPTQRLPRGNWRVWFLKGGRGSGKTWTGSKVVNKWAKTNERQLIIARTAYDARDTMIEGESGILAQAPKQFRPTYEPSKRRLTWPNGAQALVRSADEPDSIRGPQFHKAWGDELAAWRYGRETWDNVMFALRLGDDPQMVVTSTPRPTKLVRDILKLPGTVVTTDSTYANVENLAPSWATDVINRYRGTRTGLQELEGRVLDDNPDALWTRKILDDTRVYQTPPLDEIVVAVDPMVAEITAKDIRNEGKVDLEIDQRQTGIVVVGRAGIKGDMEAHGYTLDDMSLNGNPNEWAMAVVTAFYKYRADYVVAEANNGGALVKSNINTVDPNIRVELVYASRGKLTRAEPVSNIFAQGRGHHNGLFPELEDQLCLDGDTLILMEYGEKPIRDVVVGDVVRTRYGLRNVVHSGMTQENALVYEIRTRNGRSLIATGNHPLYSLSAGRFIPAANLKVGERLMSWESMESQYSGTVRSGTLTQTDTTRATEVNCCMYVSGKVSTDLYQQDTSYTTKTKINKTGISTISKRSHIQNMLTCMTVGAISVPTSNGQRIENKCGLLDNLLCMPVHIVARNSGQQECAPNSASVSVVVSITPIGTRPVYNLEVEGAHEYYANGLLVHNCEWQPGMPSPDRLDAEVWGYTHLMVDPESARIAVVGD